MLKLLIYRHTPRSIFVVLSLSRLIIQMPINASNAVTLAHQVCSYTLEAAAFTDTVDVRYVAQMMQKFMDYIRQQREVC